MSTPNVFTSTNIYGVLKNKPLNDSSNTSLVTAASTQLDGTLSVGGAATLSSTLGVTGATTLSSTLGVTGATTCSSTLGVTGATTCSSTLGVSGVTTLSSNATVGGTLGVTGATTCSSTLGVTGATTCSSTLGVTGTATLASDLALTGSGSYSGQLSTSRSGNGGWVFRDRFLFEEGAYAADTPTVGELNFAGAGGGGGITNYVLWARASGETHLNATQGQTLLLGVDDAASLQCLASGTVKILSDNILQCSRFQPLNASENTLDYLGGTTQWLSTSNLSLSVGTSTVVLMDSTTNPVLIGTGGTTPGIYQLLVQATVNYDGGGGSDSVTVTDISVVCYYVRTSPSALTKGHARNHTPYNLTRAATGPTNFATVQVNQTIVVPDGDGYFYAAATVSYSRVGTATCNLGYVAGEDTFVRVTRVG